MVPATDASRGHYVNRPGGAGSGRDDPPFKHRIWAKEYRKLDEFESLGVKIFGVERYPRVYSWSDVDARRNWATFQARAETAWKMAGGKRPAGVLKLSREFVDSDSSRGGIIVLAKEEKDVPSSRGD